MKPWAHETVVSTASQRGMVRPDPSPKRNKNSHQEQSSQAVRQQENLKSKGQRAVSEVENRRDFMYKGIRLRNERNSVARRSLRLLCGRTTREKLASDGSRAADRSLLGCRAPVSPERPPKEGWINERTIQGTRGLLGDSAGCAPRGPARILRRRVRG